MRKQFIVKKDMQLRLIFTIVLLFVLIFIISFGNIYILLNYFITKLKVSNPGIEKSIALILSTLKLRLVLIVFVNLVVVTLIGIIFTHQIAGPSFNIERNLKKMAEGDLSVRIHLRKNDQLTNLEQALNTFLDSHRTKLLELKEDIKEVKRLMKDEKYADAQKALLALSEKLNQIKLTNEEEKVDDNG